MNNNHFSLRISVLHGRKAPEEGILVGYDALIETLALAMPLPNRLSLISTKKRQYNTDH
jgi:hypothetical protein